MPSAVFEFTPFRVDAERRALLRDGRPVTLSRKAFDTLVVLLEERGSVVTKDALMQRVWPDSIVEENSLNQCISSIRKALGDQVGVPKYIETVSGRGYRFMAPLRQQESVAAAPGSLAVLPLRFLGSKDEGEWLGVGIADTLITRLSSVRELVVRPTSAVLRLSGSDPVEAGRTLSVDAVLEGSIRKAGERVRVSAQLVSVATGATIWARTFDEQFTEIFAVEDAISERVAESLTTHLSGEERTQLTRRATENSDAYRLYLNGRWYADRLTHDALSHAIDSFRQAVALDPKFALGYGGLAYAFMQCADLVMPSREALTRAEEAARQALAIDENVVDAHAVLGTVRFMRDWDRAAAKVEFERALAIDPKSRHAHDLYGWCLTLMGELDEAFTRFYAAKAIDPFSHENPFYESPMYYFSRRYDEALVAAREEIARDPEFWLIHVILGRTLEVKGDYDGAIREYEETRRLDDSTPESLGDLGRVLGRAGRADRAREILAELDERAARQHIPAFVRANIHLGLGDIDRVFALIDEAIDERSWYVTWLPIDPMLDHLRDDPRFARAVARTGL